jgi:protein-tyrosine phosphatase
MFRPVKLPTGVPGRLLLHSMPGRREDLDAAWSQVTKDAVRLIVCLAPASEILEKSPAYGRAIESGTVPCQLLPFEIPDFGVPDDRAGFWKLARETAGRLRRGEAVLIHCGAGIGRTGTLAASVLIALGETTSRAQEAVSQAGSGAERAAQRELIAWCATQAREAT